MIKKFVTIFIVITLSFSIVSAYSEEEIIPGTIYEETKSSIYRSVSVYAPAVAQTENGYVGVIATITVSIQNNGSGRVFVDTLPLTQVDMQGSARLAVKVAGTLVRNDENCYVNPDNYDYYFVVRTDSPIIGGPSAGGVMTVATISLLENWKMDNRTVMTGMINPDGSIGPIGGIIYKIDAANSVGATRFLIPKGQDKYTEMQTTTETNNGWIRTVTKPVTIDVSDYAMDNYGIEVNEASDINDALEYFTGKRFEFQESDTPITTEDYNISIKPLAGILINEAKENYENASEKFKDTGIPNYFPNYYRDEVEEELDRAFETLNDSEKWYNESLYYTSTSKSFNSLIYSKFVSYTCEYIDKEGDEEWIENLLKKVNSLHENVSKEAKEEEVNGFVTLQTVGAAQRRASEAGTYLDQAINIYENQGFNSFSEVMDFLYSISFVEERCNSVSWWIDIGTNKFNDTGKITNETIQNLALEYIEEATQSVVYSNVILSEIGSTYSESVDYLNEANDLVNTAQDNLDKGYNKAALFEALESLVKANLALEIIGTSSEEKLDSASENANNNIVKIRKQGVEPVLAVSYYEYAESLRNETSFDSALMYYKYSGMIAGALGFTNTSCRTGSFKSVGIPDRINLYQNQIFSFILGILVGVILGIGIGMISIFVMREEKKPERKQRTYNGFIESKKSQKKSYKYPHDEVPRSIKDYYKKNK